MDSWRVGICRFGRFPEAGIRYAGFPDLRRISRRKRRCPGADAHGQGFSWPLLPRETRGIKIAPTPVVFSDGVTRIVS
jgi:hypothetical protein